MAHYAKVTNGIVTEVNVAEEGFFDNSPDTWIQTSYNTFGGTHLLGGTPLRKNYAGIGYTYDEQRDAFIPPKPYNSWVLNEETCQWGAPVPRPEDDKRYKWDESTQNWVEVEIPV